MRKRWEKIGDLIDKKPPKLNEEIRRKTDLQRVKNLRNLTREMGWKPECWEDKDERLD